jgi:hypothetical protein
LQQGYDILADIMAARAFPPMHIFSVSQFVQRAGCSGHCGFDGRQLGDFVAPSRTVNDMQEIDFTAFS